MTVSIHGIPHPSDYWQLQQGDPNGGVNCAAYSGAAAVAFDTGGAKHPTGAAFRARTDEPNPKPSDPGLTLGQVRDAATTFGVPLLVRKLIPWDELKAASVAGFAFVLDIIYRRFLATEYRGSETFAGGHSIIVFPGLVVLDPLADGRRPDIFTGPAVYPKALLRNAAGDFAGQPGFAYAALTPHSYVAATPVVSAIPETNGENRMVTYAQSSATRSHMRLPKGQPLFRSCDSAMKPVTRMAADGLVPHLGLAGKGWRAVQVVTGSPYRDKVGRPTILYVPMAAGPVVRP